jgi:hypothetical protein
MKTKGNNSVEKLHPIQHNIKVCPVKKSGKKEEDEMYGSYYGGDNGAGGSTKSPSIVYVTVRADRGQSQQTPKIASFAF